MRGSKGETRVHRQRGPGLRAGDLPTAQPGAGRWGPRVTELLSLVPCYSSEGTAKEGCLPVPCHYPGPCLSWHPLDHIHRPKSLDLQGLQAGSARVVAGRGPKGGQLSKGDPSFLLSTSCDGQQCTRLPAQRGEG